MYDWAVSLDGRRLLTQFRSEVALWDTETGQNLGSWDWQIGTVNGVAFAPDGLTAAAAGSKRKLVVWDLED
jgi:WD40 repeat protein